MLSSIDTLEDVKKRLVEITSDGQISDDELPDFAKIQNYLEQLSILVEALGLWVQKTASEGKINENKLNKLKQ